MVSPQNGTAVLKGLTYVQPALCIILVRVAYENKGGSISRRSIKMQKRREKSFFISRYLYQLYHTRIKHEALHVLVSLSTNAQQPGLSPVPVPVPGLMLTTRASRQGNTPRRIPGTWYAHNSYQVLVASSSSVAAATAATTAAA